MLHISCALLVLFSFSISFSNPEEEAIKNQMVSRWQCHPCNKTFSSNFSLKRHLSNSRQHNPNAPGFTCTRCHNTLCTKYGLNRHKTSKSCSSTTNLSSQQTTPSSEDLTELTPPVQQRETTKQPSTTSTDSSEVHQELQQAGAYGPVRTHFLLLVPAIYHTATQRPATEERRVIQASRWRCEPCDIHFSRNFSLQRHHRQKHSPNPQRFLCNLCPNKTFSSLFCLKRHTRYQHGSSASSSQRQHHSASTTAEDSPEPAPPLQDAGDEEPSH